LMFRLSCWQDWPLIGRCRDTDWAGCCSSTALCRAEWLAAQLGIRAVEVDAIDDDARRFYLKFGFTPLADDATHLFLPMHLIRKLSLSAEL
jgi:hypothetical protein